MLKGLWKKTLAVGLAVAIFTGIMGYQLGSKLWDNFEVKDGNTDNEQQ